MTYDSEQSLGRQRPRAKLPSADALVLDRDVLVEPHVLCKPLSCLYHQPRRMPSLTSHHRAESIRDTTDRMNERTRAGKPANQRTNERDLEAELVREGVSDGSSQEEINETNVRKSRIVARECLNSSSTRRQVPQRRRAQAHRHHHQRQTPTHLVCRCVCACAQDTPISLVNSTQLKLSSAQLLVNLVQQVRRVQRERERPQRCACVRVCASVRCRSAARADAKQQQRKSETEKATATEKTLCSSLSRAFLLGRLTASRNPALVAVLS